VTGVVNEKKYVPAPAATESQGVDHVKNVLSLVDKHLKNKKHDRFADVAISPHNLEEIAWFDSYTEPSAIDRFARCLL
jgi:hypothetical protein